MILAWRLSASGRLRSQPSCPWAPRAPPPGRSPRRSERWPRSTRWPRRRSAQTRPSVPRPLDGRAGPPVLGQEGDHHAAPSTASPTPPARGARRPVHPAASTIFVERFSTVSRAALRAAAGRAAAGPRARRACSRPAVAARPADEGHEHSPGSQAARHHVTLPAPPFFDVPLSGRE